MSDFEAIRQNIDAVEEAYEFMLAYAAQGRVEEGAGPEGAHIRNFLERFVDAVEGLTTQVAALVGKDQEAGAALLAGFEQDSATVMSVLRILLARDNISSEMVDNTNGLIAMRSYLTTLFFIDKVVMVDGK